MENKCLNCGYNYRDGDIFCAKCGAKLVLDKNNVVQNIQLFEPKKIIEKAKKSEFFNPNSKKFLDNAIVGTSIILATTTFVVGSTLFFILNKHDSQRTVLQYKNLMENPAQIPLLKEPSNYTDLAYNLSEVENFLLLYLSQTKDSTEKKNQVFASFLTELNKIPNVLNQNFDSSVILECSNAKNINSCVGVLNKKLEKGSIKAYKNSNKIYLYPDYELIKEKYYDFVSKDYKKYLALNEKYNIPVSLDLNLLIKPKKLVDKICDFEKLHLSAQDEFIKTEAQKVIYNDLRKLLFTPSIYATQTQEMKKEFKDAYNYFISSKKDSALRPLIMSYMDKKRSYSENNFKNDYPYKMYEQNDFSENVKNSVFDDVFVQLRKNFFADKNTQLSLGYVYDLKTSQWKKYSQDLQLSQSEFVLSEPDENNNVSIYNHMFSPMQELNILKYAKLYLINGGLYAFNKDKLSISKVTFNGKTFNLYNLSFSDVSSLFPGIEVINMDTVSSYNILVEKVNDKAAFIVMSRYSQGWNDYNLELIKGDVNMLTLPNMFSVNTNSDVIFSFSANRENNEEFIENTPSYKIIIKTRGSQTNELKSDDTYAQYDEKTKKDELNNIKHTPNIMPKMFEKSESTELEEDSLLTAPEQKIDPPVDKEDKE